MHPGAILLLWMAAALFVQGAEGKGLAVLAAVSLAVALLCARAQCLRLLYRVRFLLLAILALFAWSTPGEAVFMDWPRISPSREGLALALMHAGRLAAVVCWVAILVGRMPPDRLVSGLYALARPCAIFGLPAERIALRLLLVLRYADAVRGDGHSGRDWRNWLSPSDDGCNETVRLIRERPGIVDMALPLMAGLALAAWWLR